MKQLIIGIAGGTGSGKTTVTNKILEELDRDRVAVIQHDSYYRDIGFYGGTPPDSINFDHPDSLETDLLIGHIQALRSGRAVEQPTYNFTNHRRLDATQRIDPREIIIIDGILIFVDKRLLRRIRRDMLERGRSIESVMQQYMRTVKPMHLEFVEPSKHWADIIIPRGAENAVAIDMVVAKIRLLLGEGAIV